MRVGLALPQFDGKNWDTVVDVARRAERLGFQSLWLPDEGSDPIPALAALARHTTAPRLGPLTLRADLRPPPVVAKALTTLDVLSGGRLVVSISGDDPEELGEAIEVMKGMFGGGPFTFHGRHWRVEEACCLPRPVQQPSPPIWVGGASDDLIGLAARQADGWHTGWARTPEAYAEKAAVLDAACAAAGRDSATVTRSLGLLALVGEDQADLELRFRRLSLPGTLDEWRRGRLVGTVEEVREQVAGWAALDVAELIVGVGAVPFAPAGPDDLEILADACSLGAPCPTSDPPS